MYFMRLRYYEKHSTARSTSGDVNEANKHTHIDTADETSFKFANAERMDT